MQRRTKSEEMVGIVDYTSREAKPRDSARQESLSIAVHRRSIIRLCGDNYWSVCTNDYWYQGQTTVCLESKPLFICTRTSSGLHANDYCCYLPPPRLHSTPPRIPAEKPCRVPAPYSTDAVALRSKGIQRRIVIFVTTRGS